jgi:hypothetical protein
LPRRCLGNINSRTESLVVGHSNQLAQIVERDATSSACSIVHGLLRSFAPAALTVNFADLDMIVALAQQSSFSQSSSVNGFASSSPTLDSTTIGQASITIAAAGAFESRVLSRVERRAQSMAGSVRS